ncbi:MAG TPA: hypothetical protein VG839_04585, partial [Asticcacaulis sp.]|nr:hypothetical protein [Asticcacaulis sp.]
MLQKALGFQADDRYRTVAETRIIDMYHLAGWACERQSVGRGLAAKALNDWIDLGLPFRTADGGRFFDPVEVLNFAKQAGLDGRDGFWRDRLVTTARRLAQSLPDQARPFSVDLKRTFHIQAEQGQSLRLRLPLALESEHLTNLSVEPVSDAEARLSVTRGRLEARLTAPESRTVTL